MFDITKIFEVICDLQTISNYAYDIHYSSSGSFFYQEHLFSERIGDVEETYDAKDDIIETVYLGRGIDAPLSEDITNRVAELTPVVSGDSDADFKQLRELVIKALVDVESLEDLTRGEEDLFGSIAHVLQRHNGLLFRQLDYSEDEIKNSKIKFFTTDTGARIPLLDGETKEQAIKRIAEEREQKRSEYESNIAPKDINGVKKGAEKSLDDIKDINPKGYEDNCAICGLAQEAQIRGYDVVAGKGDKWTSAELKDMFFDKDGNRLKSEKDFASEKDIMDYFKNDVQDGWRYLMNFYPVKELGEDGHVVNVYKENGKMVIYDGQNGKQYDHSYLSRVDYENRFKPELYRIDDKAFNSKFFKFLEKR